MKSEEIKNLFDKFESIACEYDGVECWSARELCSLLGYAKWQTFENVLAKAQEACQNAGIQVSDHFTGVSKTIPMPKGASKDITDFMLTRYACYLVAQNGDPRKPEISFAQNYFAVQTRIAETVERRGVRSQGSNRQVTHRPAPDARHPHLVAHHHLPRDRRLH